MNLDDFVSPARPKDKHSAPGSVPDARKIELLQKVLKDKQLQGDRAPASTTPADFTGAVERFATWVQARTYIRGDIDAFKQQLANLVALDPSIASPFQKQGEPPFLDVKDFLRQVKQHDSLHPDQAILTKQAHAALARKGRGEKLSSTDYHHLKLVKEMVKTETRKAPFWAFLDTYLR